MKTRILLTVMVMAVSACSGEPAAESKKETRGVEQTTTEHKPAAGSRPAGTENGPSQQQRCREAYEKTVSIQKKQIALASNPVLQQKFRQSLQKLYQIKDKFHQLCMSKDEQKMQVLEKIIEEKQKLLR